MIDERSKTPEDKMIEYVEDVFEELNWGNYTMVDDGKVIDHIGSQIAEMDDALLATLVGQPLAYNPDAGETFREIKAKLAELNWNTYFVGKSPAE